jgi:hypothetical protein
MRGRSGVIDVGTERVKRDSTVFILLGASDFGATQSPAALYLDTFSAHFHSRSQSLFHSAAEADSPFKLTGNRLADETRREFRPLHFNNIECDITFHQHAKLFPQLVDLDAFPPDDDTGSGSMYINRDFLGVAQYLDTGNAGVLESLIDVPLDLHIFVHQVSKLLRGEPLGIPAPDDS